MEDASRLDRPPLKFWSVFSYLIVYDPATSPLAVVGILHGAQDSAVHPFSLHPTGMCFTLL